ncbi:MAG: ABC transporter ATP-binding protein [Snowella sp.]|nr:ABC transporter ATP-binding protein [Snowella sp.]
MLKISNLCKSYGDRLVLDQFNLEIKTGEVYGLLGPNGAGKTTLINLICHLLKADSGKIIINDQPLSENTKQWLGVAPQENLLYRTLTCQENLDFYGKIYGLNRRDRQTRIQLCLEAVNLLDRAKSPVETLSGGMQRRLNIAIAMIHQPKLLILDEPTTGLDIEARYEIWQLIQQLQQQGMTILLTTHLLDEAQRLCQRIGILKAGKLAVQGSLENLRKLIPAQEILTLHTTEETQAIERANQLGFTYRRYGNDLAFWLPRSLELREILDLFQGIPIDSISKQLVQLEQIYLEVQGVTHR